MNRIGEKKYFWKADRWNGGQSSDSRIGLPGAFRFGIGLDIRSDSGFVSVAKKPVRYSDVIKHEIDWIVQDPTTGDVYYYGLDKIYKELASDGVITPFYQLTGDEAKGQGLAYFDHAIYFRSATKLGQIDLLTGNINQEWQTGLDPSIYWGPMCGVKNVLLVGHGRYVGTIDDVQFWNPRALVLPPGYICRSIFRAGSTAVILATFGNKISDSEDGMMFFWDTTSDIYDDFIPIDGNPHAGIAHKNKITLFAGLTTTIQESVGGQTEIMQTLPLLEDGKTAEIYPGAVCMWRNMIHFGISDGDSETVERVIYNYGAKDSNFDDALNPEFPIPRFDETGNMNDIIDPSIKVTACTKIGNTIRFAWLKGADGGIAQIDHTQYQKQGIHRSLAFDRTSPYVKTGIKLLQELKGALQIGESVQTTISPDPYGDPYFTNLDETIALVENEVGAKILELPMTVSENEIRSRDLHVETRLIGNGTTRPSVKRMWVEIMEDADQI